eukprot:13314-Heterococcus_DN1.PRE.1
MQRFTLSGKALRAAACTPPMSTVAAVAHSCALALRALGCRLTAFAMLAVVAVRANAAASNASSNQIPDMSNLDRHNCTGV